ncbi:MAG: TonB-dependent receptor plug domain-containing protein, partial [Novosphingobium sp.]
MPIRNRYLLFATSLTGVAWSTAAFGQDDAAAPVQSGTDIVVTATRQSQVLSKVPLSVAAYDQKSLDQQGVRRVDDIAQLTPGITFQRGDQRNASAATIAIRGISSTAGSATTGIYIDDTPIQIRTIGFSAFTPFPAVFDLQRVEVLRGPQGTLFGAGSEGGTVRFITPSPDFNALKLYARAELASTEHGAASYEGGAAVSVPLVQDQLAVRVSGYYRRDGGYIDRVNYRTGNVLDKNANWSNVKVVNAALAWKPVDAVTVTPSVYYQNGYTNDTGTYWEDLSNADQGKFRNGNALSDWNRDKFVLPALKIEADLGAVELVSNTSYFYR